jgi:hypothetical protein
MLKPILGAIGTIGVALALHSQPVQAQVPGLDVRVGAQTVEPTNNLGNVFDYGFGLYARVGVPTGPISLMGAATWTRFKPKSNLFNDRDIVTIQFGPHLTVIPGFDVGLEGAYFTEVEEFGFVPVVSVGIINFEATLSYSTTFEGPRTSWLALGVGLKF